MQSIDYSTTISQPPRTSSPLSKEMTCKRKREYEDLEEFEDVSSVHSPTINANIRGVLTNISPMRGKRKKFFDGEISDDKTSMRVVGFHSVPHRLLTESKDRPVLLSHCIVQPNRFTDELEVVLHKHTEVHHTPEPLHRDREEEESGEWWLPGGVDRREKVTPLCRLDQLPTLQQVMVEVAVEHATDILVIPGGEMKQNVLVCDATHTTRMILWDSNVGKLKSGRSYRLGGLVVQRHGGTTYLATDKDNLEVKELPPPLGQGEPPSSPPDPNPGPSKPRSLPTPKCMERAFIIAVNYLYHFDSCLKCNAKVLSLEEGEGEEEGGEEGGEREVGECSQCGMVQTLSECQKTFSAEVVVKNREGGGRFMLKAQHQVLLDIAQRPEGEMSPVTLLKATPFTVYYSNGMIQYITRQFQ